MADRTAVLSRIVVVVLTLTRIIKSVWRVLAKIKYKQYEYLTVISHNTRLLFCFFLFFLLFSLSFFLHGLACFVAFSYPVR